MNSKTIRGSLLAAGAALFLFTAPAMAQDEDDEGPQKQGDDARYVEAVAIKFKPGKRERAIEIINEHFAPATEKAGTSGPMLVLHMQTGKWDVVAIWEMAGGMADLEWYRSPDNVKWREALAEMAGGKDEAAAIMEEYVSAIADVIREVGHYHTGETE